MVTRFVDRLCRTKLERGAVKSLEFGMVVMMVAVAAVGAASAPHATHAAASALQPVAQAANANIQLANIQLASAN